MMKKIYCISGLGADHSIFDKLSVPGTELVHIPWVPFDFDEEVSHYARKMSAQIKEHDPIILGLSFGGMIAVEIAKLRHASKLFIISSAKNKYELVEGSGKYFGYLIKHGLIPSWLFTVPNFLLYRRFGAKTKKEKAVLRSILRNTNPHFVKWALKALLLWNNETYPDHIVHIHGTADRIILPDHIRADHWVEGGSHMMIYNRADEIGQVIADNL